MYVFCNKPNPPLIRVAGTKERITWSYLHKVKLQNQVRLYTSQRFLVIKLDLSLYTKSKSYLHRGEYLEEDPVFYQENKNLLLLDTTLDSNGHQFVAKPSGETR